MIKSDWTACYRPIQKGHALQLLSIQRQKMPTFKLEKNKQKLWKKFKSVCINVLYFGFCTIVYYWFLPTIYFDTFHKYKRINIYFEKTMWTFLNHQHILRWRKWIHDLKDNYRWLSSFWMIFFLFFNTVLIEHLPFLLFFDIFKYHLS